MSRRSLATPLIVAVLVSAATGLTFSTARSSTSETAGVPRATAEMPVTGLVVGRGLGVGADDALAEAFPGWRVDVSAPADGPASGAPVVVVALRPGEGRWRPYLQRYAAEVLPARTTVVLQVLDGPRRARRTADLLAGDPAEQAPRHRR